VELTSKTPLINIHAMKNLFPSFSPIRTNEKRPMERKQACWQRQFVVNLCNLEHKVTKVSNKKNLDQSTLRYQSLCTTSRLQSV
jgi:hypothetical protein